MQFSPRVLARPRVLPNDRKFPPVESKRQKTVRIRRIVTQVKLQSSNGG